MSIEQAHVTDSTQRCLCVEVIEYHFFPIPFSIKSVMITTPQFYIMKF